MKVYVVAWADDCGYADIEGVYTTREAAEKCRDAVRKFYDDDEEMTIQIDEKELDKNRDLYKDLI